MDSRNSFACLGGRMRRKTLKRSKLFGSRTQPRLSLDYYSDSPVESECSIDSTAREDVTVTCQKPQPKISWWRRFLSCICPCSSKSGATHDLSDEADEDEVYECRTVELEHEVGEDVQHHENSTTILEATSDSCSTNDSPTNSFIDATEVSPDSRFKLKSVETVSCEFPVIESFGQDEAAKIPDKSKIEKLDTIEEFPDPALVLESKIVIASTESSVLESVLSGQGEPAATFDTTGDGKLPEEVGLVLTEDQKLEASGQQDRLQEESGQEQRPEGRVVKDGQFFLALLASENDRLAGLSVQASTTIEKAEDVIGNLRSAKGQTDLLTTKKFETFRRLCETNLGQRRRQVIAVGLEQLVTDEDLLGFWSTVEGLIEGVNQLFKYVDISYEPPAIVLNTAPIKKKCGRHKVPNQAGQIKPGTGLGTKKRDEERRKLLEARKQVMMRRKKELEEVVIDGFTGDVGGEVGRLDESSDVHTSS